MSDLCPAPGPDDPLVRGLLNVVDCNVQSTVHIAYGALFQPGGAFAAVLTVLLILYVALVGYGLLLGRAQLRISDFALSALKLGAVAALATQWSTYETVVYRTLFLGPEQVANVVLHDLREKGAVVGADVFDGLQRAVADLTAFSPATPPGAPATIGAPSAAGTALSGSGQLSTLLSKAGFDSVLMLGSAVLLLVSTLGVLLAAKIVLGLLLGLGPIFIACLLFDGAQGVFVGWLRATLAFAFAPLAVTLLLGLSLTLLDPSLQEIETMISAGSYKPGVAFGVTVLVVVTAGVAIGLTAAGGMIASGVRLGRRAAAGDPLRAPSAAVGVPDAAALQPRASRTAAAVFNQDRRALLVPGGSERAVPADDGPTLIDRRTAAPAARAPARAEISVEGRLGQQTRRPTTPRSSRSGGRNERRSA
jgi:type IV secretion system protein VirB6